MAVNAARFWPMLMLVAVQQFVIYLVLQQREVDRVHFAMEVEIRSRKHLEALLPVY